MQIRREKSVLMQLRQILKLKHIQSATGFQASKIRICNPSEDSMHLVTLSMKITSFSYICALKKEDLCTVKRLESNKKTEENLQTH